jgi:hypothetical protein
MCESCVDMYVADSGATEWPEMTDAMWELAGLCWDWYRLPGNAVGGPLHIVLDDTNVEADHIEWCIEHAEHHDGPMSDSTKELMRKITDGLLALTEAERAVVTIEADPYGDERPVKPEPLTYLLIACRECTSYGWDRHGRPQRTGAFTNAEERDKWAEDHATKTGHSLFWMRTVAEFPVPTRSKMTVDDREAITQRLAALED